jgi:hypothetical protein
MLNNRFARSCTTVLTLAGLACACMPVLSQTDADRISGLERRLQRSDELIRQLESRIEQLERAAGTRSQNDDTSAAAAQPAGPPPTQVSPEPPPFPSSTEGVPLRAFADVGYVQSSHANQVGRKSGFALGNLDMYLTPELSARVKALFELNFEYDPEGNLGEDLERAQLAYTVNDALTLWAGRFHTPYGYWNTTFHHGAQLQTTVERPQFLQFEDHGGILPAHTVGLWGTGELRVGDGRVLYDAYVGNGDRIVNGQLDFNAELDDNGNREIGFSLGYRFGAAPSGLLIGVDGLSEHVSTSTGPGATSLVAMRFVGGYAVYDAGNWEILAEYYRLLNRDLTDSGTLHRSWSGYVQLGYIFGGRWTPYTRYEEAQLDQTDPYFAAQTKGRSYTRALVGMRYDLSPKAALKLEWDRTDQTRDGGEIFNQILSQFAIRF